MSALVSSGRLIASSGSIYICGFMNCGFRRSELVGLVWDDIQMRQGYWAVVDLIVEVTTFATVPIPHWVKAVAEQSQ